MDQFPINPIDAIVLATLLLADVLPVPPVVGVFLEPLGLAALFGLLTAASFALWPLGQAMRIPGAALFREAVLPSGVRPPACQVWNARRNVSGAVRMVRPSPMSARPYCRAASLQAL
jgi:putative ABC transport system permease protein